MLMQYFMNIFFFLVYANRMVFGSRFPIIPSVPLFIRVSLGMEAENPYHFRGGFNYFFNYSWGYNIHEPTGTYNATISRVSSSNIHFRKYRTGFLFSILMSD